MRVLLIFLLLGFMSCVEVKEQEATPPASDEAATPSGVLTTKSLFSVWELNNFYLDFTGVDFYTVQTKSLRMPITQEWIDALNIEGRDTTGLVANDVYVCEMEVYFAGDEESGQITVNHDDTDTPDNNACLEWDNSCFTGKCNFDSEHLYLKKDGILQIDYFMGADNGAYGVDYLN